MKANDLATMYVHAGAGIEAQRNARDRAAVTEERLPFTVRVVRTDAQLRKAVAIRQAAYARHVPALAET